jgi:putative phosphotransacetylase
MREILVETSARHIHVTEGDLETLCGKGFKLTARKDLSQPGQYVSDVRLDIVGPKNTIKNVSILGPCRKATQVEISLTDARALGLTAPVRESGDLSGSTPVTIIGPVGQITIKEGLIIAKRHIHMTPADAQEFHVLNGEVVAVKVKSAERSLIFDDVVVRVRADFALAMHIDTDESNAAGLSGTVFGTLIKHNE